MNKFFLKLTLLSLIFSFTFDARAQNSGNINQLKKTFLGHWAGSADECNRGGGVRVTEQTNSNLLAKYEKVNSLGLVEVTTNYLYSNFSASSTNKLSFDMAMINRDSTTGEMTRQTVIISPEEFVFDSRGAVDYIKCDPKSIAAYLKKQEKRLFNNSNASTIIGSCLGTAQAYLSKFNPGDANVQRLENRFKSRYDRIDVNGFAAATEAYNLAMQTALRGASQQNIFSALGQCSRM